MRKKTRPVPHIQPSKRRRTCNVEHWHRPATDKWASAEWFMSFLDAPFFTYSEFQRIITTTMNLPSHRNRATYLQFSRIRSAMCNAIPGRFVRPRRLSTAFLDAEREELFMYRADARRVLRGLELNPASDPTTMTQLPKRWKARHRCPSPDKPSLETPVFVRITTKLHHGVRPKKLAPLLNDMHAESGTIPDKGPSSPTPHSLVPGGTDSGTPGRILIRRALFLALDGDAEALVRFLDDGSEQVVSDLDVMLCQSATPFTPPPLQNSSGVFSLSSLGFEFSPSIPLPDPLTSDIGQDDDGLLTLSNYFSLPQVGLQSPFRPVGGQEDTGEAVECEVDVQQVTDTLRLLQQKESLLFALRALNATAECEQPQPVRQELAPQYENIFRSLELINNDLRSGEFQKGKAEVAQTLNFNSPGHDDPPLKSISPRSPLNNTIRATDLEQRLEEIRSQEQKGLRSSAEAPLVGVLAAPVVSFANPAEVTAPMAPMAPMAPSAATGTTLVPTTTAMAPSRTGTRVEELRHATGPDSVASDEIINSINFHSATGAALLSEVLTRAAFAKLPAESALKLASSEMKADILECVSRCVSVLVQARISGDYEGIVSAIREIPVRVTDNCEALDAIHAAARAFATVEENGATRSEGKNE